MSLQADRERILVMVLGVWPYVFYRDEMLPLQIADGGLVMQCKRTSHRVVAYVEPMDVVPILKGWGYPVFRETAPAIVSTTPSRLEPDPPM